MKTSRRGFLRSVLALAVTGTVQPRKLWTGWDPSEPGPGPAHGAAQAARIEAKVRDEWIDLGGFLVPNTVRKGPTVEVRVEGTEEVRSRLKDTGDPGIECWRLAEVIHATDELLQDSFPYLSNTVSVPGKRVVIPIVRPVRSGWEQIVLNEPVFDYVTIFGRPVVNAETGKRIRDWKEIQ